MSQPEFLKTIEYCLSFINIKPTRESLEQIFRDIDLKGDGQISYVDYFTFLK
jgi:Ca2+-binding EF-hand superfamily protein